MVDHPLRPLQAAARQLQLAWLISGDILHADKVKVLRCSNSQDGQRRVGGSAQMHQNRLLRASTSDCGAFATRRPPTCPYWVTRGHFPSCPHTGDLGGEVEPPSRRLAIFQAAGLPESPIREESNSKRQQKVYLNKSLCYSY